MVHLQCFYPNHFISFSFAHSHIDDGSCHASCEIDHQEQIWVQCCALGHFNIWMGWPRFKTPTFYSWAMDTLLKLANSYLFFFGCVKVLYKAFLSKSLIKSNLQVKKIKNKKLKTLINSKTRWSNLFVHHHLNALKTVRFKTFTLLVRPDLDKYTGWKHWVAS